jgi:hypothetical protein
LATDSSVLVVMALEVMALEVMALVLVASAQVSVLVWALELKTQSLWLIFLVLS